MGNKPPSKTDRRGALRLALAAAVAPSLTWRHANAQAVPGGLIDPPARPMAYQRILTRDLIDGNSFSVARIFTVEFQRFSGGFMVHGRQDDVSVNAPRQLAQFAEIESSRDESDMFPLALDPFGLILSRDRQASPCESVEQAIERTLAALSDQQLGREERDSLQIFVASLHAAGQSITAHLPVDLFAPSSSTRCDEHSIALPDGGQGRVTTRFGGERDDTTGLMRVASREIVTEVDNSRRTTSESWNLAPA